MRIWRRISRPCTAMLAVLAISARAPACFSGETPDSGAAVP